MRQDLLGEFKLFLIQGISDTLDSNSSHLEIYRGEDGYHKLKIGGLEKEEIDLIYIKWEKFKTAKELHNLDRR